MPWSHSAVWVEVGGGSGGGLHGGGTGYVLPVRQARFFGFVGFLSINTPGSHSDDPRQLHPPPDHPAETFQGDSGKRVDADGPALLCGERTVLQTPDQDQKKMAAMTVDPVEQPRMYQQTLLQDGLCDLLENEKFVDCILKIKDEEFPCHRLVLAASSPFFKAMFLSDLEESKKREIVLRDVEPGIMGMILRYLYTSDINLTEQNVQDIFIVANMYQIPSIFSVCVSYLQEKMVLGNCLAIFRLGLLLDCSRLVLAARDFICERFQVVAKDQDFLQLGPSELALILTSDALNVTREELVFESLMDWVKHDEKNRLKELRELLHCIRFRLVPLDYFKEKVEGHQYLRFNQDIEKNLELVKDAHRGRLPQPEKLSKGPHEANGEDEEEEEGYLPGILNNNPRFGMFEMDLILMISDTGTAAYDPVGNECFLVSESTDIPKNHCSLVTSQNQVFVVGGMLYEENKDEPFSSYFLQVRRGQNKKINK